MRKIKKLFRKIWKRRKRLYKLAALLILVAAFAAGAVVFAAIYQKGDEPNAGMETAKTTNSEVPEKKEPEDPEKILEDIGEEEYSREELALDDSTENEKIEETEPVMPNIDSSKVSDRYPYYIMVNRQANCVTVYGKDENGEYTVPVKAMVCSVGVSNATPVGTFKTSDKYAWRYLFGDVYGQYAYRINKHILFHSVPYYSKNKGDLESEEYNKLGEPASLGCIRLSVADAKWLIDNCPKGTTVTIYDSPDPGPLGKPTPLKIDLASPNRGWDPTDPSEENPWKGSSVYVASTQPASSAATAGTAATTKAAKIVISVPSLIEVNINANQNLITYLKSRATVTLDGKVQSGDILKVDISALNGKTKGDYKIVYQASNAKGEVTKATTTVRLDLEAPVIQAPSKITINASHAGDIQGTIASQIRITDDGKTIDGSQAKMDLKKLNGQTFGYYDIQCQYTDQAGNTTVAVVSVYLDTVAPVITSRTEQLIVSSLDELTQAIEESLLIEDNSGEACTTHISYEVIEEQPDSTRYQVTVEAADRAGNVVIQQFVYEITLASAS